MAVIIKTGRSVCFRSICFLHLLSSSLSYSIISGGIFDASGKMAYEICSRSADSFALKRRTSCLSHKDSNARHRSTAMGLPPSTTSGSKRGQEFEQRVARLAGRINRRSVWKQAAESPFCPSTVITIWNISLLSRGLGVCLFRSTFVLPRQNWSTC